VSCSVAALSDSGLWSEKEHLRIGIVMGFGAERMQIWDEDYRHAGRRVYDSDQDRGSIADSIRQWLSLRGPTMTVSAACASGNHAISQGCHWLDRGWVDVCLVGAGDMGVTPYSMASFGTCVRCPAVTTPRNRPYVPLTVPETG